MMNTETAEALYPCPFKIKVIGEHPEELTNVIVKVMSSFDEAIDPDAMSPRYSKNKKYVSITFEIVAQSREYIEKIYSTLNAQDEVKMVM
jgi:uncharacterized protein